ncbi:MAG: hypothetical protein ABW199_11315 [Caulobacterales bacterium]
MITYADNPVSHASFQAEVAFNAMTPSAQWAGNILKLRVANVARVLLKNVQISDGFFPRREAILH